ncbi:LysM peptidoglycan-binding domain-containing protein [Loigolactobacillus jiayinensis]|uniref:LysM peptidoglycan-binding domain-containing protein n=1 Tax=Loigolactobacillus jiayinensis TaxID=2486016 RepID=A0ABW1RI86_9LACO|nr:LysM domain-containing protein [Loigolactobacillus jiayinensis]
MSKRDQKLTDDKPWDAKFEDDRDDKGNLSRSATHRKDKSNTLFVTILTIALLVLAALPVGAWTIWQNQMNRPVATESAVSSSSSSAKQTTTAKKQATKSTTSHKSSSASSQVAASTVADSSSSVESASTAASTSSATSSSASSSSSSSSANASYVSAGSGQGLYTIAKNNGLTISELLQLNGLTSTSTIKPGQQIRVK